MVGLDGVDDLLVFLVALGHVYADLDVRALDLMVQRLADIVQQAGPFGHIDVHAQLAGQQACQLRYLDRVVEHVLAVAGAVAQPADEFDQFGVDGVDAQLHDGALPLLLDDVIDIGLGFLHHLLDAGGMDAAVLYQALQRHPGHFAAHRVKTG